MAKLIINLGKDGTADLEGPDGSLTPVDLGAAEDKTGAEEDMMEDPGLDDMEMEKSETAAGETAEPASEESEEKAAGTEVPVKKPALAVAVGIGKPEPKKRKTFGWE